MTTDWQPPRSGPRIYGLRVREPLTLGHVFLLDELESPVLHGGPLLPGDVALAAFVCSMPHANSRRQLGHRTTRLALSLWGRLSARHDHDKAAEDFSDWFYEEAKAPERWIKSSPGVAPRECAAPWWINRAATAMGMLGMTFEQALDVPLKRLVQLASAYAESRGEVELVGRKDREFFEMVERAEAARRN